MGNMTLTRKRGVLDSSRVLFLPVRDIRPNPNQPRTTFSLKGLEELSASIREHGILQPLTVRRAEDKGYELISGERRLRAAKMAGLDTVPCILIRVDDMESSLLALIENLQRRDLDFVDEALALEQLISTYHLSQEEAARRLGKSQSAVANKLRLLKLSAPVLESLRRNGLTERHGRALLRLSEEQRLPVLEQIIKERLTVSKTDELVDKLLLPPAPEFQGHTPVSQLHRPQHGGDEALRHCRILRAGGKRGKYYFDDYYFKSTPIAQNALCTIIVSRETAVLKRAGAGF